MPLPVPGTHPLRRSLPSAPEPVRALTFHSTRSVQDGTRWLLYALLPGTNLKVGANPMGISWKPCRGGAGRGAGAACDAWNEQVQRRAGTLTLSAM
mgnify:CR=1 FL=1